MDVNNDYTEVVRNDMGMCRLYTDMYDVFIIIRMIYACMYIYVCMYIFMFV